MLRTTYLLDRTYKHEAVCREISSGCLPQLRSYSNNIKGIKAAIEKNYFFLFFLYILHLFWDNIRSNKESKLNSILRGKRIIIV
jgi:hypothetical protein